MNQRIYLYKSGRLHGPFDTSQVTEMRQTGSIRSFSWMIEENNQTWVPVESPPRENPFLLSKRDRECEELSATFILRGTPVSGKVTAMNSFGLEIVLPVGGKKPSGIPKNRSLLLNLVNTSTLHSKNIEVIHQSMESTGQGILLRFSWPNQKGD